MGALTASIAKYGGDVRVTKDGVSRRARAIVQPIRYKNKIYIGGEMRSLGSIKREKYLYIGTPETVLHENATVIESVGGKYIVKRCETFYVQDSPVYVWAIMAPFGARREDDYDGDS